MKNTLRRFTAWILTLIMVASSSPMGASAAVFTYGESNRIIDTSEAVQIVDQLFLPSISTTNGDGSVTVSSIEDDVLPKNLLKVSFEKVPSAAVYAKRGATAISSSRELARYDISVQYDENGQKWEPKEGQLLDVTVDLNDPLPINDGEVLSLIHYADGSASGESIPATFITRKNEKTGTREVTKFGFSTDGFSVYAINWHRQNRRLQKSGKQRTDTSTKGNRRKPDFGGIAY